MRKIFLVLMAFAYSVALPAHADSAKDIAGILARDEAPPGVVFEVVQSREGALEWAIPQVKDYAHALRTRFPRINIAVVSHGREQFSLLKENANKYAGLQDKVRSLTTDDDIPVHVCGTHASWYEKHPEDFPDYINIAPSGPAQIRSYRELGYMLVVLQAQ